MQAIRVYYSSNAILIDTVPTPFVAGTLKAVLNATTGNVEIRRIDNTFIFAAVPWQSVADIDGNTFATSDEVMAYLAGQFAMRRPVGETFGVPVVAGADLIQGQPVAVSRASGRLLPARADTYTQAFVAGVASADTAQGFTNQPAHGAVTLPDWSALTGAPSLNVGELYFVGPAGGLTAAPRLDTTCVARVGLATGPQTLVVEPSTPILL